MGDLDFLLEGGGGGVACRIKGRADKRQGLGEGREREKGKRGCSIGQGLFVEFPGEGRQQENVELRPLDGGRWRHQGGTWGRRTNPRILGEDNWQGIKGGEGHEN